MKAFVVASIGLTIAFSSAAECLLQIGGRNSVSLRSAPDSGSPAIRELPAKTIVQVIKAQTIERENWLQVNQPAIGWIPLKSITTFCGETSQDQTANVNAPSVFFPPTTPAPPRLCPLHYAPLFSSFHKLRSFLHRSFRSAVHLQSLRPSDSPLHRYAAPEQKNKTVLRGG
jgi:hypothetical protein